ncbi:hypothetical protein BDW62DRAFT_173713 [Aspergillus aurantiobrunneus]
MRTRSQPDSPGGFVSLEQPKRATRRTTRSASRAASQEPSSQQSTESSVTQPTTRSKSQRTTRKTTTKKTTSTAEVTKPQGRKGSKRGTRNTTRKAARAVLNEAQKPIDENHSNTARTDNEDNVEVGTEEPAPGSSTSGAVLLEPKNSELNRKRSRTENSPDDNTEPATPYANKRRNVGPAGSTPFARRHTDLTRRLSNAAPYSERLRRRRAESQGRIHSTIFRLPQFVAQTEADRRASETSESTDFSTEPLQTNLDISSEQAETDDQAVAEEPAITQEPTVAQEPSTPEPANRGWNISGLLNSVPRSFSRFLPKFGRSPARSEVPASQQPASERIRRIQPSEVSSATVTERESQSRRRLSEQPPTKRARNLSYSLFPTPIDRSLYLGDVPTETTARTTSTSVSTSAPAPAPALAAQPAQEDMPQRVQSQTESQTLVTSTERGRDSTPKASNTPSESHKKKRKRSSSPDVIPNPAGASYGLDLDYFDYSSDNEDDEAEPSVPQTEPRKTDTFGNTSLRSAVQSERPASKKVRFDQSPEDTPSKRRRPHATEPYHGDHFRGLGDSQALSAPTTPTPQRIVDPRQRPGFIPNRTGTFELNYDDFSDDSDSDDTSPTGAPTTSATTATPTRASTTSVPPPNGVTQTPTSTQSGALRSAQPPASGSAAVPASNPSLDKLRSKAEKYKPKTPSGLRTASRYSSPLTAPTPDMTPDVTPTPPAEKMTEKVAEKFGDDQFAKDAQWLYEKCPSGDLRKLDWPETRPFGENLNVSANALRILNEIWDPAEIEDAYDVFQREYAEFKKTLA